MQTDTFTNLIALIKGLTGNTAFTTAEGVLVASFANRRIYNAYRRCSYWPRYLVTGEARAASGSIIPFEQATLNTIDTILRVWNSTPYVIVTPTEYDFLETASGARVFNDTASSTSFYVDYKKTWAGDYNETSNTAVPLEFYHYAAHGAFADFLRYDGQTDKAAAEEQYAEGLLLLELENPMIQRNANTVAKRIRSHATQQHRT